MASVPRAGTGDSVVKSRRYLCLFELTCQGNLSMCVTFLIRLLPHPDNRG